MKLKKKDKVALVEAHVAMTQFKELTALCENQELELHKDDEEKNEIVLLELGSDSSDESETSDDENIYCVCRGPDDGRFMICCDACDEWYHGECVGMDESECKDHAESDVPYICTLCRAN
ncbi:CXXC-type zinc finger protein 1-like [Dendronephthya gigantea]|uniref:CXXC-type zinc finger protein 1-like n=1 Tax=Dendronephthya gigantea TaxID=151771 RepID=UPI00106DBBA2|nr:CXXC-type zinc finger protein 1-like [Dendronephthya gigantea]